MDERTSKGGSRELTVRDRRYSIRYPFAADVELLDMESGARTTGVTSDISMGGIFVCTSKPMQLNSRVRVTLARKDQKVEALGVVRIVKPRIGMGVEFIDVDAPYDQVLALFVEFTLNFQTRVIGFCCADRFNRESNPILHIPLAEFFCGHRAIA